MSDPSRPTNTLGCHGMVRSRICAFCLATMAAAMARGSPGPESHFGRELARVDSLDRAGNRTEALALVEPILEQARAESDSYAVADALRLKGRLYFITNRVPESEDLLRESLTITTALGDTDLHIQVLTVLGFVVRLQGRREEARRLYEQMLDMATASGNRKSEAAAMQALADDDRDAGRFDVALSQYRKVLAIFEELEEPRGQSTAWLRIGACFASTGDLEGGRDAFLRAAQIARGKPGLERLELAGEANAAQIEMNLGDPAGALAAFERIYRAERAIGSLLSASHTARNIVEAELQLGRASDAAALLEEFLPIIEAEGMAEQELELKLALAAVHEHEKQYDDATDLYRWILARPENYPVEPRLHAVRGVARCLVAEDRRTEALSELENGVAVRARGSIEAQILYDADLADALLEAGRHEEALAVLRRLDRAADEADLQRYRVAALVRSARCHRESDRPDSAFAALELATEVWERERTVPLDYEWRALRSVDAHELAALLASLHLHDATEPDDRTRQRRAFDALQRFKARTLMEQLAGPGAALDAFVDTVAPTNVEELQAHVLEPGEILLDVLLARPSMIAAVTTSECRVVELSESASGIRDQLDLYRRLLAAQPGDGLDESAIDRVTVQIGELLLAPFADLLGDADRVIFTPGGEANLIPLSLLRVPDGPALIDTHRVARVPSATLLAWYRREPASAGARDHKLLAISGSRAGGRPSLPGARKETLDLAKHYRDVSLREPATLEATTAVLNELADYDVVHVSAHTFLDDERPWNSGVVLGVGEPSLLDRDETVLRSGEQPGELMLRASDIVGLELGARLAVLSACETASGRIVSGEGVQGLTTAFLGAGVRSVVATLWPVDDATTALWVEAFYQSIAKGKTAAESVRLASQSLRSNPQTAHPFHWAGFVLVGDGDTRVELERKSNLSWMVPGLAMIVIIVVATRRRRRRDLSGVAEG